MIALVAHAVASSSLGAVSRTDRTEEANQLPPFLAGVPERLRETAIDR
jgi:hypothetical protein